MKSTNFLVATIDNNFNMFKQVEGSPTFIDRIAEHIKRLEEISEGHHFFIDEHAFKALGETNFPLRFTRVFSTNPDSLKRSTDYRVQHIDTLSDTIASKDKFSPNVQIFFIGTSDFLLTCSKWSKKLLLTVVNRDWSDNALIIDKFPLEQLSKVFKKRRTIEPELLAQIKAYKILKQKKLVAPKETIIADNGMKIIQDVVLPDFDASDEILNTPDYIFYE